MAVNFDPLRQATLCEAMSAIQSSRSVEVGGHTWQELVDTYGEAILFAEIASIVSRLKRLLWDTEEPNWDNMHRMLDLTVDLGNFTEFLYQSLRKRELSRVHVDKILFPE